MLLLLLLMNEVSLPSVPAAPRPEQPGFNPALSRIHVGEGVQIPADDSHQGAQEEAEREGARVGKRGERVPRH